ncbi:MAG: hypothetical protein ACOX6U_05325 [Oscillospiraceae bacterium]
MKRILLTLFMVFSPFLLTSCDKQDKAPCITVIAQNEELPYIVMSDAKSKEHIGLNDVLKKELPFIPTKTYIKVSFDNIRPDKITIIQHPVLKTADGAYQLLFEQQPGGDVPFGTLSDNTVTIETVHDEVEFEIPSFPHTSLLSMRRLIRGVQLQCQYQEQIIDYWFFFESNC